MPPRSRLEHSAQPQSTTGKIFCKSFPPPLAFYEACDRMKVDFDAALLTSPERFSRCSHSKNGVQLLNAKLRWRIAPEGSGAVRRIPFGKSEANPYSPPLASPGGKLSLSAALRNR